MTSVNSIITFAMVPGLPFGGVGESGFGRIHGPDGLREFTRERNEVPGDVYDQPQHFWEVLLHKLTCSRIDLVGLHDESRAWLAEREYTTDLGGY